jgi:endogenous inhibitor of DNA gyrase (YacG/DUF329 family)
MMGAETVEANCPACKKFVLLKVRYAEGNIFVTCPLCGKESSAKESLAKLPGKTLALNLSRHLPVPKTRH